MGSKHATQGSTRAKLDTGAKTGVLTLSRKKLTAFPSKLLRRPGAAAPFAKLRSLDLSHNKLRALGGGGSFDLAAHLPALAALHLHHNQLASCAGLQGLAKLQSLDLSHNALAVLPALPLGGALKTVNVSHNQIQLLDFPSAMHGAGTGNGRGTAKGLAKLKEWHAAHNRIVGVSAAFYTLCAAKLERLDLSHNALEQLVGEIALLQRLVHLDVSHNSLAKLPGEALGSCRSLQTVLAASNRLTGVPAALLENGTLSRLRLEGNAAITKASFLELPGAASFMERRKQRVDREIGGGLHETDRTVCGLD